MNIENLLSDIRETLARIESGQAEWPDLDYLEADVVDLIRLVQDKLLEEEEEEEEEL